jgi:hypothetical protein
MTANSAFEQLNGQLFIGGEIPSGTSTNGFDLINSATDSVTGRIPDTTGAENGETVGKDSLNLITGSQ